MKIILPTRASLLDNNLLSILLPANMYIRNLLCNTVLHLHPLVCKVPRGRKRKKHSQRLHRYYLFGGC